MTLPTPRPPARSGFREVDALRGELENLVTWAWNRQHVELFDLRSAVEACVELQRRLGITAIALEERLVALLPRAWDASADLHDGYLFAVSAMLGTINSHPTWDTPLPGSADGTVLGDVELSGSSVSARRYDFATHLMARKAFISRLVNVRDVSAIRRKSRSARDMADALAASLGVPLTPVFSPSSQPEPSRRVLAQLASRLDEHPEPYPAHLTPTRLVRALRLSDFRREPAGSDSGTDLYKPLYSTGGSPALDVIAAHRRMIVVGNPGGGKSTVLTAGVVMAARRQAPAVFARLSSLAATQVVPRSPEHAARMLIDAATEDFGLQVEGEGPPSELVRALVSDPEALVALDGLDEVHADDLDRIHNLIRTLSGIPGRLIISSRVAGYSTPPGRWRELAVNNLTSGQADAFFRLWFGDTNPEGLTRARTALASPRTSELMQVPVLLGIVAAVAASDDVPQTEAALYAQYVSLYLVGKWRPRSQWLGPADVMVRLQVAKQVAWQMATGLTGQPERTRWRDVIRFDEVISERATSSPGIAAALITHHGLLTAHGQSPSPLYQRFRWLHRTVHEHLVGAFLADLVRSDARVLRLPDALLMGPAQWYTPLRHMVGLLESEDHGRLLARIEQLQSAGDPGGVLDVFANTLAESMPADSPHRRRLARTRFSEGRLHIMLTLDPEYWLEQLPVVVASGHPELLSVGASALPHDARIDEAYVRLLLRLQRDAPRRSALHSRSFALLSAFDPDDALAELVAASSTEFVEPPYLDWKKRPSDDALATALATIATWPAPERVRYLDFLAGIVGSLTRWIDSMGLTPQDAAVGIALARARSGRDAADVTPVPLPAGIVRLLLSGAYGDEEAFDVARRVPPAAIEPEDGAVAQLAAEIFRLGSARFEARPEVFPRSSADLLAEVSLEAFSDVQGARDLVIAATRCVESAKLLPPDWALRVTSRLTRIEGADPSALHSSPNRAAFDSVREAVGRILVAAPRESLALALEADPAEWLTRPPRGYDFPFAGLLNAADALGERDIVALARWADSVGASILHNVRLGASVDDVLHHLWVEVPHAFATGEHQLGAQLAAFGLLHDWRERILAATRDSRGTSSRGSER